MKYLFCGFEKMSAVYVKKCVLCGVSFCLRIVKLQTERHERSCDSGGHFSRSHFSFSWNFRFEFNSISICVIFSEKVYLYFCFAKPRADLPMYLIHVDFIHLLMFKIQ